MAAKGRYEKATALIKVGLDGGPALADDANYALAQIAFAQGQTQHARARWLDIVTAYIPSTSDLPAFGPTTLAAVRMLAATL